ncbi:MAG: alpha/beta fold hydrolase [Syntrophales bacterium]|nr:alpha/beta fold hydrolase [Syntrophales bacterium]
MADRAINIILDGGNGVRLSGRHTTLPNKKAKAFVLIIHGWEGSSNSTYVLHAGRYLYRKGCEIFRLNLRDHGDNHHLNEGLFNGTLIEETAAAVLNASRLSPDLPFFIIGFSLGGNFALRIAMRLNGVPGGNLRHVICVSPLIDPYRSTLIIDRIPLYRHYFLRKWKRSLRRKQLIFPHLYQFDDMLRIRSTLELTERIIDRYSGFDGYRDYFNRYTLGRETLGDIAVPSTIIASRDDPVIPVDDIEKLDGINNLKLSIQRYGGHCGFLDPFPWGCWYEGVMDGIIERSIGRKGIL